VIFYAVHNPVQSQSSVGYLLPARSSPLTRQATVPSMCWMEAAYFHLRTCLLLRILPFKGICIIKVSVSQCNPSQNTLLVCTYSGSSLGSDIFISSKASSVPSCTHAIQQLATSNNFALSGILKYRLAIRLCRSLINFRRPTLTIS